MVAPVAVAICAATRAGQAEAAPLLFFEDFSGTAPESILDGGDDGGGKDGFRVGSGTLNLAARAATQAVAVELTADLTIDPCIANERRASNGSPDSRAPAGTT